MTKKKLIFALCLFVLFSGWPCVASIVIYPEVKKVVAPAGTKVRGNIWIYNNSAKKVDVMVEPEDWTNGRKKGVKWLKIHPLKFKLKPKKYKQIKYKAKIPKTAEGDLVSQIFFSEEVPKTKGINIKTRIGAIIYITVEGTLNINVEISDFKAIEKDEKILFNLLFANKSNVHLQVKGNISVIDSNGNDLQKIEVKPWTFLAQQTLPIRLCMEKRQLGKGTYTATAQILCIDPVGNTKNVYSKVEFSIDE